jgi:anti-anti-sigma regulatory factor
MSAGRAPGTPVAVLDPGGDLLTPEATAALVASVKAALAGGSRALVIRMGAVRQIADIGLGCLIQAWALAREHGGRVVLGGPLAPGVRDFFTVTRLLEVLEHFESEARAVEAIESWLAEHAEA